MMKLGMTQDDVQCAQLGLLVDKKDDLDRTALWMYPNNLSKY